MSYYAGFGQRHGSVPRLAPTTHSPQDDPYLELSLRIMAQLAQDLASAHYPTRNRALVDWADGTGFMTHYFQHMSAYARGVCLARIALALHDTVAYRERYLVPQPYGYKRPRVAAPS